MLQGKVPDFVLMAYWLLGMATVSGEQELNTLQGPEKSFTFTGTNATFTCVSPLKNCVNMSWYKETDRYPSWDSWTKINYNIEERFGGKFIVQNSTQGCTLIVTNVQKTDYKYFRCTYPNYSHGFAKLVVIDGPREHPLTGPENQFGFVGSDVNFTCISPVGYCVGMNWFKQKVGRGRETISISRFGNYSRAKYTVMGSRMGCQLTVKRLELNDASSVICEIVISHRTYEGTAFLLVFNRTENPLKGPRDSLTYVGANATFKCVSPLENCVNITWYKQEFVGSQSQWWMINYEPRPRQRYLLENSRFSCSLTVMNVYVTDSGLFKCQFMNHFEATAQLFAIYAQENPLTGSLDAAGLVGRNIAFTCVSPLKNCVEMTWWVHIPGRDAPTIFSKYEGIYLSDKYIVENSAVGCQLTVKRLQLNDTATYYCEIRISQTIYDHVAQLFVFSVQQENPLKGPNISMSFVGTNADFTCVSPLKSCASITWHQDLRINSAWARIDPDSNPDLRYKYVVENSPLGCKLTVKNVQVSDYAPIKCIFLLTFERTADLMVFAAQENPLTGPVNYTGFVGQNFTFDCSSPLKNCVGINWYKKTEGRDRDTIFSGNNGIYLRDKYTVGKSTEGCRLTVKNVDFNDKGSVSCEILISHRSFTGTAALIVRNHTIGR